MYLDNCPHHVSLDINWQLHFNYWNALKNKNNKSQHQLYKIWIEFIYSNEIIINNNILYKGSNITSCNISNNLNSKCISNEYGINHSYYFLQEMKSLYPSYESCL